MPGVQSRLADIEGPGLGGPPNADEIADAIRKLQAEAGRFLNRVGAGQNQRNDLHAGLNDLITDATARQLREIEENEE